MTTMPDIKLACPRCDRALDDSATGHRCEGCKTDFPLIDGIPWLFAEPNAALADWRNRFEYLLRALEANVERYRRTADTGGHLPETVARLTGLADATAAHGGHLRAILEPLAISEPAADIETYLALRTRLPPDQGLTTYFPNVHRDWCWGDEENEATHGITRNALGDRPAGRTLVLGAGSGRLAYDLHQGDESATTIALDFNPLLAMLGQRITRGETIELHEFPLAPIDSGHLAPLRRLAAPRPGRDGLSFVLADVHRAPFGPKSFDTIVTPWLVDIIPGEFSELCARINHWLDDDGIWINFGSLNFHQSDPAAQLTPGECRAVITAQGFAEPECTDTEIPYLRSPSSRHSRREIVFSWAARKHQHIGKLTRHQALPDWLVRRKDPVPLLEHFQVAATSTRIHAHVMSMINGRRSIADMAALMQEERLMPAAEAESAIQGLLIRLFDESQIRRP